MVKVLFWFSIPLVLLSWARIFIYGFMMVMVIHTALMAVLSYLYFKEEKLSQHIKGHFIVMTFIILGIIGVPSQAMPIYGYPMSIMGVVLATFLFNRVIANRYLLIEMICIFILGALYGDPERAYQHLFEWVGYGAFQFYLVLCLDKIRDHLSKTIERLNEAITAKTRFLATMSHEIRTPLHGITLAAENLMEDIKDEKSNQEMAEVIIGSSKLLKGIINDILDYSKLDNDKITVNPQFFKACEFIESIEKDFRNQAKLSDINFTVDLSHKIKYVYCDPFRLEQILRNLLTNAFKFTSEGHVAVSFDLSSDKSQLVVTVSDTGTGISKDRLNSIFDEFEQESSEVAKLYGGTGLGLAIVKGLINLLQGEVTVESELEKGTTFKVYLPHREQEELKEGREVSKNISHINERSEKQREKRTECIADTEKTILVVEDNDINIKVFTKRLSNLGFEKILIAKDGKAALKKLKVETVHLVFMDIQMPVMDGLSATKEIRAGGAGDTAKEVPIIGLSANSFQDDIDSGKQAGMNDYLGKPLNVNQLIEVLNQYL